jgi:hypothetical protein
VALLRSPVSLVVELASLAGSHEISLTATTTIAFGGSGGGGTFVARVLRLHPANKTRNNGSEQRKDLALMILPLSSAGIVSDQTLIVLTVSVVSKRLPHLCLSWQVSRNDSANLACQGFPKATHGNS